MSTAKNIGEPERRQRVTAATPQRAAQQAREQSSRSVGDGKTTRKLCDIAANIKADWRNIHFGAQPYVEAMLQLNTMRDSYGSDSAEMVVRLFLNNAKTWSGPIARRVKEELNGMLEGK